MKEDCLIFRKLFIHINQHFNRFIQGRLRSITGLHGYIIALLCFDEGDEFILPNSILRTTPPPAIFYRS